FPYAAFLPWEEASELLKPFLRSPDADLRGAALKALLSTTRYQRAHLADALQLVRDRRNEQDPVRCEMLAALAGLPRSIWQDEHLEPLGQILDDARNATDLSYQTEQAMSRLAIFNFPAHPVWAAQQMAATYRARGHVSIFDLEKYLSDEHVRTIAPLLTPILRSWSNREQESLLISLANALGKRLRVFDELAGLLEKMVGRTKNSSIANSALTLLLEHQYASAAQLIPRLLQEDKSLITLPAVYTHLHERRQDLLTPFLGQQAYKGRFSTGKVRFILPVQTGFRRWTPTQQKIFMRTLLEVVRAKDQNRAVYEWLKVIRQIAAMPAVNFTPLIELASDERKPVRESALHALGYLDAGQGIPTLLGALNDERARIAIYALRTALLDMPPNEALRLLRGAPLTLVTVAKEVVRLIGELATEEAYRELLTWEGRDLHRDVRVALLRALWDYLDAPETWEVFTRAAQAADPALARGVVHIPVESLSPSIQPRLAELTATLLAHPATEVRIATLQWREQHPVSDHRRILFTRLLALLHSPYPDECRLAANALFAIYTGQDAALVGEALKGLLDQRR
ncbi:MAG TPA: hypothetical protein VHD63_16480, partial [Ktedonobacteraceae bacterium]|nr:hypothetical protein [Ktedonobacteraceae bacterium]